MKYLFISFARMNYKKTVMKPRNKNLDYLRMLLLFSLNSILCIFLPASKQCHKLKNYFITFFTDRLKKTIKDIINISSNSIANELLNINLSCHLMSDYKSTYSWLCVPLFSIMCLLMLYYLSHSRVGVFMSLYVWLWVSLCSIICILTFYYMSPYVRLCLGMFDYRIFDYHGSPQLSIQVALK